MIFAEYGNDAAHNYTLVLPLSALRVGKSLLDQKLLWGRISLRPLCDANGKTVQQSGNLSSNG